MNKFNAEPIILHADTSEHGWQVIAKAELQGDVHSVRVSAYGVADIIVYPELTHAGTCGTVKRETYTCRADIGGGAELVLKYVLSNGKLTKQHLILNHVDAQHAPLYHVVLVGDERIVIKSNNSFAVA